MTPERKLPILLVDDDDDTRASLRDALELDGFEVVEARNGQAALDMLVSDATSVPRLLILDLMMPVMSGWEFLPILKSYTRLATIPVIVVSVTGPRPGSLDPESFVAWLQKPYDVAQLISLVRAHAAAG